MKVFNEWINAIANLMELADLAIILLGAFFTLLKRFTSNPDPEKQAYRQRVKTRRRNQEARPEWDHIGRCIWHFNRKVPDVIQMEHVPQAVQDTFSCILYGRAASGLSMSFSQTTSDQHHTYLMEAGKFPGGACVFFWAKPN